MTHDDVSERGKKTMCVFFIYPFGWSGSVHTVVLSIWHFSISLDAHTVK